MSALVDKRLPPPVLGGRRVAELTRFFRHRWGTELPDDDAGRDDARLMLAALSPLQEAGKRSRAFLSLWAPWMKSKEIELMISEAHMHPQFFTADELADRLGLTLAERTRLGIFTIGAVDCDRDARKARRAEMKRQRERKRYADAAPQRAADRQDRAGVMSPRVAKLYAAIPSRAWIAGTALVEKARRWEEFDGVGWSSLRRVVNRVLDQMVSETLIEQKVEPSKNDFRARYFRRLADRGQKPSAHSCPRGQSRTPAKVFEKSESAIFSAA